MQQHADHNERVGNDNNVMKTQLGKDLTNGKAQLWQSPTAEHEQALQAMKAHHEQETSRQQVRHPHEIEELRRSADSKLRDLRRKDLLANSGFWEDFKRCTDVAGLYDWAADYGIDVRMYPKLFFRRLCYAGQPLPALLSALEDAVLGTPRALNFLLDWQLRRQKGEGRLRKRIKSDDMILLQQWMRRQLYLGLKTEEDILVFLRFISRVSDGTNDEALRCNFIVSISEGLQSSSVFGFKDLGRETQCRLFESITRGPVTRQSLDLGFSLIEAMRQSQLEGTDRMISAFIGRAVHTYASLREDEKLETRFQEVIPMILEMIGGLPQELACSVILTTTKALMKDHYRMPALKAAMMQLPHIWWSALAKTDILELGRKIPLKTMIELFLSSQKLEVVIPYLQRLDDRNKARFILRYWFGPKTRPGRARARYLFDRFCSTKGEDSPWISMFQAVRERALMSSEPWHPNVKQVFQVLQMLRKSETIVEIIKQAKKFHGFIDESDVVYTIREHLSVRPYIAERLFHFYPRLRLEKCPELAERMILDRRSHPDTALRYMWSRRTRFPVDREGLSQLRRQLLERMALAYSSASHITPRMAFRKVHACYSQHTEERLGRPSVAMARALTRAGLIQPLQAGQSVSTPVVRWILSIVRSTESTDVADQVAEMVSRWRGANLRNFGTDSLADRRARHYAAKDSMAFRVRIKWSKHYSGYEKVYEP